MDREKVIKGLECCLKESDHLYSNPCNGCPYEGQECIDRMKADALALLKEQEAQKFFVDESGKITPLPVVVQCKDCKWFIKKFENEGRCIKHDNDYHDPDWFCADGERK